MLYEIPIGLPPLMNSARYCNDLDNMDRSAYKMVKRELVKAIVESNIG